MIDFLQLVGLSVIVRREDYAILQGRGGRVAVHPLSTAESGGTLRTSLTLEVPDAVATTSELTAAGLDATWWDESWGRQAWVAGPEGRISVNAEMTDFHGYRASEPERSLVDVNAVVFTARMEAMTDFFGRLGFLPDDDETPGWRPLRAGSGQGVIGLHRSDSAGLDEHGYLTSPLGFETTEALATLAQRLRAAGHPVEGTDVLSVTDPDGELIEIHPARG